MQINEAGRNDQSFGVEFFVCATANLVRRSNFRYLAVAQQNVHERVHSRNGVNQVPVANQKTV